jgi:AhpD family alkylhydroperoxidase
MHARMKNPATVLPDATRPVQNLFGAAYASGADHKLLELVHLRVSQMNGCSACVYAGVQSAQKGGDTIERIGMVAAWREAPFFTDAERAALQLAEDVTRLADRSADAVSDEVWDAAADHFDEKELAAIILMIGATNMVNRFNATIQEPAGATWG